MTYEEWETMVPEAIAGDALWRVQAYRLALFAADIGWEDVNRLVKDRRTRALADQLYRSLGSISANIAEGYSRGSGKDRARFYEMVPDQRQRTLREERVDYEVVL